MAKLSQSIPKKISLLIGCWCIIHLILLNDALSQHGIIEGFVLNGDDGKPIAFANVLLNESSAGDATDSTGYFRIDKVMPGVYALSVKMIGYHTQTMEGIIVRAGEPTILEFKLKPAPVRLPDVEVRAKRVWGKQLTEASVVGIEKLEARDLAVLPGTFDDPVRAVQVFSGAGGVNDYSGFLAVRGNSPEHSAVVIDGMIVPNPYRFRLAFGGGMSIVNPGTVKDVFLHLGGFSAAYGNSLASLLEIQTRAGSRERIYTRGSVNLTDMSASVEGPLPGAVGSFMLTARRTYYDLVINRFAEKSDSAFPYFSEVYGKWLFDIDKNDQITVSVSRNREGASLLNEFSDDFSVEEDVTTQIANLSWRRIGGPGWRLQTSFSYYNDESSYNAFSTDSVRVIYWSSPAQAFLDSIDVRTENRESLDGREIHLNFRQDLQVQTGQESWLNLGVAGSHVNARNFFDSAKNLGFIYARTDTPEDIRFDSTYTYIGAYAESDSELNQRLHVRIGARFDYSDLIAQSYFSPRLSVWYKIGKRTAINGSWGYFFQYPNPMVVYAKNLAVDLSRNLDELEAEKAIHHLLALERNIGKKFTARLQLYSIDYSNLLLPESDDTYAASNSGEGNARGGEIIFEKKSASPKGVSFMFAYAFGDARFRQEGKRNAEWFRLKFDRRHALTLYTNMRFHQNWSLSVFGQYASGLPFTDAAEIRVLSSQGRNLDWHFAQGKLFGAEFPPFKKLDLRLSYRPDSNDRKFEFYLDLTNVTNEKNVAEITWEKRTLLDGRLQATRRQIYMLPRLLSFGVGFTF